VTSAARVAVETVENSKIESLVGRVQRFDELLTKSFGGDVMMTMFMADLVGRTMEFYVAAHESAIWLKASGGVELLDMELPTSQIGRGEGIKVMPRVVSFSPGDFLILYTDGILELKGTNGRETGLKRYIKMIEKNYVSGMSAHDMRNSILQNVIPMLQNQEQPDDILMLVVRIK
jgi:serine phosphatase RsbU (regulator of sigma subunit)